MSYRRNNNENEKYGFVYLWYDVKHKRYYVGCHWGTEDDGYICSSNWMRDVYRRRPQDFRRKIIKTNIPTRESTYIEEQRYLDMIKPEEIKPLNDRPRYYNLNTSVGNLWHQYDDNIKTIGQKISASKKGKLVGPMTEERKLKISQAKKEAFASRGGMSEEHKEALKGKRTPHSEEWKKENSERMKKQWADGTRKKAEPKVKMLREDQDKLCSQQLKSRWANPVWAENQRKKLKESWHMRKSNNI